MTVNHIAVIVNIVVYWYFSQYCCLYNVKWLLLISQTLLILFYFWYFPQYCCLYYVQTIIIHMTIIAHIVYWYWHFLNTVAFMMLKWLLFISQSSLTLLYIGIFLNIVAEVAVTHIAAIAHIFVYCYFLNVVLSHLSHLSGMILYIYIYIYIYIAPSST